MERSEAELIAAVLQGDSASFEPLIQKYSPRVFATEIEQVEQSDIPPVVGGFTFFPDEGGGAVS